MSSKYENLRLGPFSYDISKYDYFDNLDTILLELIKIKNLDRNIKFNVTITNKKRYNNGNYNITFYVECLVDNKFKMTIIDNHHDIIYSEIRININEDIEDDTILINNLIEDLSLKFGVDKSDIHIIQIKKNLLTGGKKNISEQIGGKIGIQIEFYITSDSIKKIRDKVKEMGNKISLNKVSSILSNTSDVIGIIDDIEIKPIEDVKNHCKEIKQSNNTQSPHLKKLEKKLDELEESKDLNNLKKENKFNQKHSAENKAKLEQIAKKKAAKAKAAKEKAAKDKAAKEKAAKEKANKKKKKVACYDFDGVIHTCMRQDNFFTSSSRHPDNDFIYFVKRHPLFILKYLFKHSILQIKNDIDNNYEVYIVSANNETLKKSISSLFDYLKIEIKEIFMNISNKVQKLKELKCNKFVDDSCMHIKDVYHAKEKNEISNLEELYWAMPEHNCYFKIKLDKPLDHVCNTNNTTKWNKIDKIEKIYDKIVSNDTDIKTKVDSNIGFTLLNYNLLYTSFYLEQGITTTENMENIIKLINYATADIMVLVESKPITHKNATFKSTDLKNKSIPSKINDLLNDNIKIYKNINGSIEINEDNVAYHNNGSGTMIFWSDKFKKDDTVKVVKANFGESTLTGDIFICKNNVDKVDGGRPAVGVKLIHKETNQNIIVIGLHLAHNYILSKLQTNLTKMISMLNYDKSKDKIIIMGDFNELYQGTQQNELNVSGTQLNLYKENPDKTCCGNHKNSNHSGSWDKEADLIYSDLNIEVGGVVVTNTEKEQKNSKFSDHYPLFAIAKP